MSTAAIRRHWTALARFGCIVTGRPAEIAHCHGGSLLIKGRELGRDYTKAKGLKLAYMDWLTLPISPELHRIAPYSLDQNVAEFEYRYGTQVYWLDEMVRRTGTDVWALAKSRHSWAEPC
jgi:hypothetical protein